MTEHEGMLSPYRVLDLTEGGCMVGGKILADLGADVIKVEAPGGSPSRKIGPFYKDIRDPEKSLFWFAYNTNKRGITLDIDNEEGCELFRRLVRTADIVLESFAPGYLDDRGVGYEGLCEANPDIILASITPFGQTGPKAHYKGSELTAWASGGALYAMGEPDRPPVWVSFPQAYLHGGAEAASGSLIALWHRAMTGEGQHVDVSIQQCVIWCLMNLTGHWECHQWNWPRDGMNWKGHQGTLKGVGGARCKDGHVAIVAGPVPVPPIAATFEAMKALIIEEGKAPEWWLAEDWYAKYFELQATGDQELIDQPWKPIEEFLPSKTKAELYELALEKRLLIAPAQSVEEICKDPQLEAREYWQDVEHPELGDTITYCGAPIKMSEAPWKIRRRAPLIGEHNQEVYEKDLGLSMDEVVRLEKTASTRRGHDKPMAKQACEGIKVLDFSWAAVGPMSVRYLADHGARVIHVQSWSRPCFLSFQRPRKDDVTHPDYGYWAAMYNASKYSISVNLKKPTAQDLIKRIITVWQPDILVESFTPGVMKSFGLDYESVKELKPDIIYDSTCIQGQYGPHSHYPGYGNLGANLAGFCYVSGWPDRDISPPYGAYTDFINMKYGAAYILAAMEYRRRTGKGVYLDQSQYEVALHFMAPPLMDHTVNGRTLERNGNRLPDAAPHGVYRCKGNDRWAAIAVFGDEQWSSFCDVIGNPGWSKDSRFRTHPNRKKNEDELDRLVGEWSVDYTPEQVESMMQGAGLAANVVESVKDLFEDPQLKTRNHFRVFNHKVMGAMHFEGPSFKLSKTPDSMWCPATYGEHNEYVFKEILGMTEDEISGLTDGGEISTEAHFHDMIAQMLGLK